MEKYKGIMIYGETSNGKINSITTELLGCGRRLADEVKEELVCLLVGENLNEAALEAITFGADKVFNIIFTQQEEYLSEFYTVAVEEVINAVFPRILLFGQTDVGRDLAPRVAFKLHCGLIMDCLGLQINFKTKQLEQDKPVYGGNARAVFVTNSFPQIATVRRKAMLPLAPDNSRKGEIVTIYREFTSGNKIKIIATREEERSGIKLEDASIVISGGRGIGDAEGFEKMYELARILNGAVGASKHPCDYGWISDSAQIGVTGKIISPDLYFAFGISGASQHMAGCSGSKNIIAINKNADANIFNYARFGMVGNWKEIYPAFVERVKELLNE